MLRAFFGDNYTALSRTLNWKPYWGWNPEAEIVHFHGPKPVAIRNFLAEGLLPSDPNWAFLLQSDRTGLEAYTRLWYFYHERVVPEFATAKSQLYRAEREP